MQVRSLIAAAALLAASLAQAAPTSEQLQELAKPLEKSGYGQYLLQLLR